MQPGTLTPSELDAIMGRSSTTHRSDEWQIVQRLAAEVRAIAPTEAAIVREHGIVDMRLLAWFWDRAHELVAI